VDFAARQPVDLRGLVFVNRMPGTCPAHAFTTRHETPGLVRPRKSGGRPTAAGTKPSRQGFKLELGSVPMIISGPRAAMLALPTLILPIGFALAQGEVGAGSGAVVAPSGTAVVGIPPGTAAGGGAASPPITGQSAPPAPTALQGIAEQAPGSTVGLSRPAADGSTKIIPARPCSAAAHETDGTTTCVGIPH
jgi:hypothetical protein